MGWQESRISWLENLQYDATKRHDGRRMTAVTILFDIGRQTFFVNLPYAGDQALLDDTAYAELSQQAKVPDIRELTIIID